MKISGWLCNLRYCSKFILLIWNIWNILKRIIPVSYGSAFFFCVVCVYSVDICFLRMRDRARVEAIGSSTIEVSEEVIVIEELKCIFFENFLLWRGVEAAIGRKRKEWRSLEIFTWNRLVCSQLNFPLK